VSAIKSDQDYLIQVEVSSDTRDDAMFYGTGRADVETDRVREIT
jgi:hypothetical protein